MVSYNEMWKRCKTSRDIINNDWMWTSDKCGKKYDIKCYTRDYFCECENKRIELRNEV